MYFIVVGRPKICNLFVAICNCIDMCTIHTNHPPIKPQNTQQKRQCTNKTEGLCFNKDVAILELSNKLFWTSLLLLVSSSSTLYEMITFHWFKIFGILTFQWFVYTHRSHCLHQMTLTTGNLNIYQTLTISSVNCYTFCNLVHSLLDVYNHQNTW